MFLEPRESSVHYFAGWKVEEARDGAKSVGGNAKQILTRGDWGVRLSYELFKIIVSISQKLSLINASSLYCDMWFWTKKLNKSF